MAQVFADTTLAGIQTAVGRREEEAIDAKPNRIVAVPLGAPVIRTPNRAGDNGLNDPTVGGRILLVREFVFEVICSGVPASEGPPDYTQAETNYLLMLVAARQALHNSVRFRDEEWIDQQKDADSFARWGSAIRFFMEVHLPVYERRAGSLVTLPATAGIATAITEGTETVNITQGP